MHLYICSTRICVSLCTCMGKDFWLWCQKTETPQTPDPIAYVSSILCCTRNLHFTMEKSLRPLPYFQASILDWSYHLHCSWWIQDMACLPSWCIQRSNQLKVDCWKEKEIPSEYASKYLPPPGRSAGNKSCKGASLAKYREARGCCHLGLLHRWPEVNKSKLHNRHSWISIYTLHKCHILPTCTWKCLLVTQRERLTLTCRALSRQDAETGVPLSSITKTLTHRVPSNK